MVNWMGYHSSIPADTQYMILDGISYSIWKNCFGMLWKKQLQCFTL